MHDFKSHIQRDFLAFCTRPVSVLLAMECVGCSFDNFSIFLRLKTPTKSHEKCVFLYPFSNMAIKRVFYTGKLYGLTGMTIDRMTKRCMLMTIFAYFPPIQFSSVQLKMVSVCSEKPIFIYLIIYACHHISQKFFPTFSLNGIQASLHLQFSSP